MRVETSLPRNARRRSVRAVDGSRFGTRATIVATATRLFADRGYHRTSLHEVAAEVGIQKASIFHHFASKDALYRAVLEDGRGQGEALVRSALDGEGGWSERVHALLDAYIGWVAAHPEQTKILLRQSLGDAPEDYDGGSDSDRLLEFVAAFIDVGQGPSAFPSVAARTLVLGVMGMVVSFFTSAPVVAPGWFAELGDDRVARLRHDVTVIVDRMLALAPDTTGAAAVTPRDCRGVRAGSAARGR